MELVVRSQRAREGMRQMYRLSRAFKLENGMRSNQLFRNSPLLGYQIYGLARGGRVFSTIPAEANTNSSNSSQDSNQKKKAADDDDFLSRHGGKVALVAFSIAAGLVYTYYLSIQDRNSIEKAVDSYEMPIDPYELLDLRNANQIKGEQFSSLLQKFLEAEQLSKYSESKINGSTTPNEQDHSEINVNEKSKSSRKVVNIPCLTYEKFIEFIKTNQTTFHQNVSPYYPRLANVILLPYLLERIIQTQVTKDFVPLEKLPTKFPFMMYDILTPEEQEEIDEERENRKKGKIPILAKNKDLFRLYPDGFLSEGNDDLSRPPQGAISSHFVDIPVAYDYLFLLLTMLMQDQNFPINIQQRLSSLYELALSIQVLQSQETSFIPDSSSIISSDAKSDGIISRGKRRTSALSLSTL